MGSAVRAEAGDAVVRESPILSMVQGDRELDLVKSGCRAHRLCPV
jgi:hypothetical protein